MEIKVSTLRICIIVIAIITVISVISYYIYDKEKKEEIRQAELVEDIKNAIDKEYENLLREYNFIWDIIQDSSYPLDFRITKIYELNKLLEQPKRYTEYDKYSSKEEFEQKRKEDKVILRNIASKNIQNNTHNFLNSIL